MYNNIYLIWLLVKYHHNIESKYNVKTEHRVICVYYKKKHDIAPNIKNMMIKNGQ